MPRPSSCTVCPRRVVNGEGPSPPRVKMPKPAATSASATTSATSQGTPCDTRTGRTVAASSEYPMYPPRETMSPPSRGHSPPEHGIDGAVELGELPHQADRGHAGGAQVPEPQLGVPHARPPG